MILKVQPAQSLNGTVRLPASKSYSIRAFIIAACSSFAGAKGGRKSKILHPSDCDDAKVAFTVGKALSAKVLRSQIINVRESGTVLRFLLPLLALRIPCGKKVTVVGEGTLIGRPNVHLLNTLRACGVDIKGTGPKESVPITINGGTLRSGKIKIDGSLSSQFISSLLIACPQLKEDSDIILTGKTLVSSDYIVMTNLILKEAGVVVKKISNRHYHIKGSQTFSGLKNFEVPSDYGLAAFLLAAAALIPSNVTLQGSFQDQFIQADGRILEFLKKMGVRWERRKNAMVIKGPFALKGGTFSLKDCPDLVPIMAVLGLFAKGGVRLKDIGHARVKESDRISDLRQELLKIGAQVDESPNELRVFPLKAFNSLVTLDPHRDHRLAMAFTVLGLKTGITVADIECVKKSYPQFVRDMKILCEQRTSLKLS
jgi:3-phosphoshikimate 1-carboxyvinyltransferase